LSKGDSMAQITPLTPNSGDSLPILWAKILTVLQSRRGAIAANAWHPGDSITITKRKVLCALLNVSFSNYP